MLRAIILVSCTLAASSAASSGHPAFDKRLSEVGLTYSLPPGFADKGSNVVLEKELNAELDSASPFVVHQVRSTDGNIAAWLDVRMLGIDLTNRGLATGYPIVFRANAAGYCEMVSGGPCSVLTTLTREAAQADYHADFAMVFNADHPDPRRIQGHKKARVIAISKPSKGMFYLTIAYDSDDEFEKHSKALMQMLSFS